MGRRNRHTTHHIIPRSRDVDGFEVHRPDNKSVLKEYVHQGLHLQYYNQTPQEQLETWLKINIQVLSNEVREALWDLFYEERYIKG
jgi:hypothetical protein